MHCGNHIQFVCTYDGGLIPIWQPAFYLPVRSRYNSNLYHSRGEKKWNWVTVVPIQPDRAHLNLPGGAWACDKEVGEEERLTASVAAGIKDGIESQRVFSIYGVKRRKKKNTKFSFSYFSWKACSRLVYFIPGRPNLNALALCPANRHQIRWVTLSGIKGMPPSLSNTGVG